MSRAEWPGASTRASAVQVVGPPGGGYREAGQPAVLLPQAGEPVLEPDVAAPGPAAPARMRFTTWRSTSVPMWGLWDQRMSSGAPCSTRASSTAEMRPSWVPVVSLPSEKVPAPPSPNWTLEARVQHARCDQKRGHVGGALLHRAAPLQHNGGQPRPGQEQGGEQARRAHAHHHRRQGGGPGGGGKDIGLPLKQGDVFAVGTAHQVLLVVGGQLYGADVVDVGFFPGVNGLAGQGQVPELVRAEPQQPGGPAPELLQVPVHGEGKIADSYHVIT